MRLQDVRLDGSENSYIEIDNTRLTLVDRRNEPEKDWAGTRFYLRFSAYKDVHGGTFQGAELPVTEENVLDMLRAIAALLALVARELSREQSGEHEG